jgi:hypothetical protein
MRFVGPELPGLHGVIDLAVDESLLRGPKCGDFQAVAWVEAALLGGSDEPELSSMSVEERQVFN